MPPVAKRILIQGGLAAAVLAVVGLLFAEMAGIWAAGNAGKPNSADLNPGLPDDLRVRIPLTMAAAGFLFVAVGELIARRFRVVKPPAAKPADTAEMLLNELLAQAEAKMALEKRGEGSGERGQEEAEKKPEGAKQAE